MDKMIVDQKTYKIHTIKVNRFKTTKIEVIFRNKATKDNISTSYFLASTLGESSKSYPSRKDVAIKCEDLYKSYYYAYANRIGNTINTVFSVNFINPEYINEKNYLNDTIKFLFEMILNPNIKDNKFDNDSFNIVLNESLTAIDALKEIPEKSAINNALTFMDNKSISSSSSLGNKEDFLKINRENLVKEYEKLIKDSMVDIFVIGNTNMDNIVKYIKKYFDRKDAKNYKINYYVDNKTRNKVITKEDSSSFMQSQLVMIYNTLNLTKDEKEVTIHLLNYILGNGGLSSKLYRYLREEAGLCYQVSSMYFKYDNLLCIASSLAKDNIPKAIKLVKKSISEMQKGLFTEDDITDAKKSLLLTLNVNKNNPSAILANYEFNVFVGNYLIEEKIDLLDKITKKDIITLASKIKDNVVYILSEDNHERN